METLTNKEIAALLSLATHRERYPVVRWIEENIASGRANDDYGTACREVIHSVHVKYKDSQFIEYLVEDGVTICINAGSVGEAIFEDKAKPTTEEIDLLEVVDPNHFAWIRSECGVTIPWCFDHPHSCRIEYKIMEEECAGCGKWGPVNYRGTRGWENYCGAGPRCCP